MGHFFSAYFYKVNFRNGYEKKYSDFIIDYLKHMFNDYCLGILSKGELKQVEHCSLGALPEYNVIMGSFNYR